MVKKNNNLRKKLSKAISDAAFEPKLTNLGNFTHTGKSPAKARAFATGVKRAVKKQIAKKKATNKSKSKK